MLDISDQEGKEISLDKQVAIYSIDTSDLYIEKEIKIHRILNRAYYIRNNLKYKLKKEEKNGKKYEIKKLNKRIFSLSRRIKALKNNLYVEFNNNQYKMRYLREENLSRKKEISIFNSVLTRTLGLKLYNKDSNFINEEIIVVQTYYFDVLKSIINNGFMLRGKKYICFTASAGQIRNKKTVFIQEDMFEKYKMSLLCGLTPEIINDLGGVNINKYLAYLALCNSATDEWDFDLDKSIVVEDMELSLNCKVDYINDQTFEIKRQNQDIVINHTDGCGMMLPKVSKNNFMIRLPWVKGLLVSFPFDKFIKEKNGNPIIKDIYGKEWNIIEDNIQIIFTKSQFKMWKYYNDWQDYKNKFNTYGCKLGICNEEEEELRNKRINYQMLQTLTDLSDKEIGEITSKTNDKIKKISSDKKTMLEVFGVHTNRNNMNNFQKSLLIYPELLEDNYTKHSLKQIKKKRVEEGKAGKLEIDCKYSFVCPDLYAFCEFLFLDKNNVNGLLNNGEISFIDYPSGISLDCLRSPHLYREHAIRLNIHNKEINKWFTTKGVYTSIHDPISKILMFDVDGDTILVVKDRTIVKAAERNMKDIFPLYYEMKKADNHTVDGETIYNGLVSAYTGGNIGVISNDITKVWNSEEINIDVIKWLCMINNFTIDYAKTLYKPEVPKEYKDIMSSYKNKKVPYFFIYAKDKEKNKVESENSSVMNRISKAVINKRMDFSNINKEREFDHEMLMTNKNMNHSIEEISEFYSSLDRENAKKGIRSLNEKYSGDNVIEYNIIRNSIIKEFEGRYDLDVILDSLILYLFKEKNSKSKRTFWHCFGEEIYNNLKNNLKTSSMSNTIPCESCGTRIEKKSNRTKYCDSCVKEIKKEQKRLAWNKNKDNYKN